MALLKSFSALRPGFQPWSRMTVKVSTYMSFCRDPLQNDRGRLPHSTLGAILPRRHPVSGDAHCSLRLCPDVSGYVLFLLRPPALGFIHVPPQVPLDTLLASSISCGPDTHVSSFYGGVAVWLEAIVRVRQFYEVQRLALQ